MTNTCSKCQYWRTLQQSSKPICTNMQSKLFNANTVWNETCPSFVRRGQKAPLWMRLAVKELTGLKCSSPFKKANVLIAVIVSLLACGISMEMTLLYLIIFKGVLK